MEGEREEDEGALDCTGNRAPRLSGPFLVKSGEEVEETTFQAHETIGVAVNFLDKDCNLGGGKVFSAIVRDGDEGQAEFLPVVLIPENIPCEGYFPEATLGFNMRLDAGSYTLSVGLKDACDEPSNDVVEIKLDVVEN